MNENQLNTLTEGVFQSLSSLSELSVYPIGQKLLADHLHRYLDENQLNTLAEGVFQGLPSLRTLSVYPVVKKLLTGHYTGL